MTRNLKALGLALVAAMAIGAFGAQGASAHQFTSDSDSAKTTLTGFNESYTDTIEDPKVSESRHKFTATAGLEVLCDAEFAGTVAGNSVDTVTVHPKYHNCTFKGEPATVDTGGCNYVFGSDTTVNTHPSGTHASVTLECESAHEASPHTIKVTTSFCNLQFETTAPASTVVNHSLHGVTYTNLDQASGADEKHSSKSAITVNATVRTITYTVLGGSFCGLSGHAAGTYTNGSYDGLATVTGYKDSSSSGGSTTNGFTWTHGAQVNISVD